MAVAILGGVPAVLTVTGNGSPAHSGNAKKVAGAADVSPSVSDSTGPTAVTLPTNDTVVDTSSPAASTSSILNYGASPAGRGVTVVTSHPTTGSHGTSTSTRPPTSHPTTKPTKPHTTPPVTPTSAPPVTTPDSPTPSPPVSPSPNPPAAASVGPTNS